MDITGKIIMALPEVSGVSKAGKTWKKKEYVLETQETYPKKIFFDFFGEKADQFPLQVGQMVRLYFDIDSREYQGRWYTSIRGWKTEDPSVAATVPQQPAGDPFAAAPQAPYPGAQPYAPAAGTVPPPPAMPAGDSTDDLPF